jgi:hypothetical protein
MTADELSADGWQLIDYYYLKDGLLIRLTEGYLAVSRKSGIPQRRVSSIPNRVSGGVS